jgi:hypothetical protein
MQGEITILRLEGHNHFHSFLFARLSLCDHDGEGWRGSVRAATLTAVESLRC